MQFNVNSNAAVQLTDRLERLNRSAFPVAVRGTLNDAAFDVKTKTLQRSAANNFIRRSPNFFKTFSGVNKATGFNLSNMKSAVGMTDRGKISARTAIANMDKQEAGGSISEGAAYLADSRSGNNRKKVTKANYFKRSSIISGPFKRPGGTSKSQFVAKAFASFKHKKKMSFKTSKGRFLMQVTSIKKHNDGRVFVKSKLLMKSRSDSGVRVRATHFSREAAVMTQAKMGNMYRNQAEKQFQRALNMR